ncbi:MAG: cbb3-type cytochrome oxidase assembly protein CcoS [Campylobacter sputorum]|uniref:cbb3-type cytochrome oxidase assembly protein CcoS n=1 Tax=Campylobacter sputorum TaxID=206 RepID=UPI00053BF6A5|nr:cbb3-type cytochrome oxidase assembly protein CcoS [Campylobacter sputorum]ASM38084.1 cytochrome oxidase maturation protein, cbb3-type [Campylobacter sputorum bv. paraureolyticus LMG 11764]MDY6121231.1 cbb3-type cytochrome oxidase assembly protein CcoS [Campylobacter sputorum]
MSVEIIALMLSVSIFLGLIALGALLWALKNRQFDDHDKFLRATQNDGEDALNDAYNMEIKKKEALKKKSESKSFPMY